MLQKLVKAIHHNVPQLLVLIVKARIMLLFWGRGTGKSTGPVAEIAYENLTAMPASVGAIGCDSYKHLKKSILPECYKTWKKLGLEKGRDFWVEEKPPKHLGIPEAIRPIESPENCIFWRNGSVIKFFSYNFQALDNGDSIDWLINDEQKLIKPSRHKETVLCVRGNEEYFGHSSRHLSITMVTDMPDETTPNAGYLFDMYDQMDKELIDLIISLYYQIQILKDELEHGSTSRSRATSLKKEITRLEEDLDFHRGNAVYVSEATTIDNLHALGYTYIKNMLRTLPEHKVKTAMLNIRPDGVERGYYPYINEDHHGYTAIKEDAQLSNYMYDDCRIDDDIHHTQPLEICLDYNKVISWIAVGQKVGGVGYLQNVLSVEYPKKLEHLCQKFDTYYKHLPNKELYYYYDHTATGENATTDEANTYKATIIRELTHRGWNVIPLRYYPTTHHQRFDEQSNLYTENETAPYIFRFNIENCRQWLRAARLTRLIVVKGKNGKTTYEKSKVEESDKSNLSPKDRPHVTEAVDGLQTAWFQISKKNKLSSLDIF